MRSIIEEIWYGNISPDTQFREPTKEAKELMGYIADYLHIKQNTYSQYESGQRQLPISCLIALAKFYKTSTDYILGLTENRKPYN